VPPVRLGTVPSPPSCSSFTNHTNTPRCNGLIPDSFSTCVDNNVGITIINRSVRADGRTIFVLHFVNVILSASYVSFGVVYWDSLL
jgi:hypothetical protein